MSDEQAGYQIHDRLSFREFLGLSSGDRVPDTRTIWLFQERLIANYLEEILFAPFHHYLDTFGLLVHAGKVVDASFVEVLRQRNRKEENAPIKSAAGSQLWDDQPYKKRQKDIDARWTEKGGQKFYGYKDHTKIDSKSKLIDTLRSNKRVSSRQSAIGIPRRPGSGTSCRQRLYGQSDRYHAER